MTGSGKGRMPQTAVCVITPDLIYPQNRGDGAAKNGCNTCKKLPFTDRYEGKRRAVEASLQWDRKLRI